jgi:hypothetical protein
VFKCFPFLCDLMMSVLSLMVPYVYPVFNMSVEYSVLVLLFLITRVLSLYLLRIALPVCV